jgi:carbon storage regulator CsrA
MLVLSRKKHESIVIGEEIEIEVLKIEGNRIRLGIRAPAHVHIRRSELPLSQAFRHGQSADDAPEIEPVCDGVRSACA